MTFSSKVKDELLNVEAIKPCCILAECYGLLLFGRGFSAGEVYISTENKNVALRYKELVERFTENPCNVSESASEKF